MYGSRPGEGRLEDGVLVLAGAGDGASFDVSVNVSCSGDVSAA